MCPSGVDEFPNVTTEDLEIAFQSLAGSKGTILVRKVADLSIPPLSP